MTVKDPEDLNKQFLEQQESKTEGHVEKERLSPVYVFNLDVEGQLQPRWTGRFKFKVPSLGERIRIGQIKNEYLPNGSPADTETAIYVHMVSWLEVTLQEKPAWWKPMDFMEDAPLAAVYREVLDYEDRFRGTNQERSDDQEADRKEQGLDGDGETDVGRKVQPPSQRRKIIASHP